MMGLATSPFPFVEYPTPHGAENNDAGHVQRPTGKTVPSHLGLAHGVEKELEVPGDARDSTEKVVIGHGNLQGRRRDEGVGGGAVFAGRSARDGMLRPDACGEVLVGAVVFAMEIGAPEEVGGEAAQ